MTIDRTRSSLVTAAIIAITAAVPAQAHAEDAKNDWQYTVTIYGWLPAIDGHLNIPEKAPGVGGGTPVSVDASKILDALNFTFMGMFTAEKDRWGVATDIIYLDLGASQKRSKDFAFGPENLPAGVTGRGDLGIRGWLLTLDGTYRVVDNADHPVVLFAGARMLDLTSDLNWKLEGNVAGIPVGQRSGRGSVGDTLWDGIVGVKGRANFGKDKKWFVPYYLDVGTGDSQVTWQWFTGVGYAFDWGDLVAVWRYLDYNMSSGDAIEDLNMQGGAIGVTFRF